MDFLYTREDGAKICQCECGKEYDGRNFPRKNGKTSRIALNKYCSQKCANKYNDIARKKAEEYVSKSRKAWRKTIKDDIHLDLTLKGK